MLEFLVERGGVLDAHHLAVDAHPGEAGFLPLGQFLAILTLAPANDRGEQIMARPLGKMHHAVDHLADLLRLDRKPGGGRVRNSDTGP